MTDDVTTWLLKQIAEEEEIARRATDMDPVDSEHQARWTPSRVLAECEAKRRIVDLHTPEDRYLDCPTCTDRDYRMRRSDDDQQLRWCDTLKLLTLPYADHPGYREEWRP